MLTSNVCDILRGHYVYTYLLHQGDSYSQFFLMLQIRQQ